MSEPITDTPIPTESETVPASSSASGCAPYNELLAKNQLFYASVMAAVAAKNKLDSGKPLENRDKEIRCLLKAIACKKTNYLGVNKQYSLAEHTVLAQTDLARKAASSKVGMTGLKFSGGKKSKNKRTKRKQSGKKHKSTRRQK